MDAKRDLGKLYRKGERIFRQGDEADGVYVLQKGRVEIVLETEAGDFLLTTLRRGDIFGEVSLFAKRARFATARAARDSLVLWVDEKSFIGKLHQDPSLAYRVLRQMAERIYEQDHELIRSFSGSEERCRITGFSSFIDLAALLDGEVKRARRLTQTLGFALIDIDDFKGMTERYGEAATNGVLRVLGEILREHLRRTDIIGRYADDRFGIILFDADGPSSFQVLEKVRQAFMVYLHPWEGGEFTATFGCGVAIFPEHEKPAKLGKAAHKALIRSKEEGGNLVVLAEPGKGWVGVELPSGHQTFSRQRPEGLRLPFRFLRRAEPGLKSG
ncbi:MAG: GGDEF domain-containing protein [Magnetococcales bacterium]|nr:GGDEF domain-containing protein [Magnetococcales bacterium]MBF0156376.1 GGDEF domain-containing protein [Magnetococcales bacterium]